MRLIPFVIILYFLNTIHSFATPYNIANKARVSASSVAGGYDAFKAIDQIICVANKGEWIRFEVTDAAGMQVGLSEIEVFTSPEDYVDHVSWVNPYIETARGRYFFFITGNQPYGMIGAAPLTRNKNQYGGGYNYNSSEVLGFPQIHCWMLSGLTVMPVTGEVDPTRGEESWKSPFLHDGEIVQPGCSNAHVFSHAGKPWLTQYWVRRVKEQAYGAVTPDSEYGGHDEDQGQMGGVSSLMAIGLFALDGGSSRDPHYDITSPVFDEVTILLDTDYYKGRTFKIKTYCWNYGWAILRMKNGENNYRNIPSF